MKGCRSLYWSRVRGRKISLREFLDIKDEKTDEELAQETYTDPKSHVLTIWDWKKCIARRPMLPVRLHGQMVPRSIEFTVIFCIPQ